MSLTINTAHSSKLSSKMLNDKIHELIGKNIKISGFTVLIKDASSITIAPGKCIILGAIIEENSDTKTLKPSLSGITDGSLFVYMVYEHENKRVNFTFSTTAITSEGALKLATITVTKGVMTSVANEVNHDIKLSDLEQNKANLDSPHFTGTPTAPTAGVGTNNTQLATTEFVTKAVANKTSVSGNAGTATKLQTPRKINGVDFDGTKDITVADNTKLPLSGGTMTGELINGKSLQVLNPSNNSANVTLGFHNNIPRIRYGGTGEGATSGFQIHGTGDVIKLRMDEAGELYIGGTNRVYHAGNKPSKADVGLGNVTNESKLTMFQSAALTGTPTAPTANAGTNSTQIATTAFVTQAVANKTSMSSNSNITIQADADSSSASEYVSIKAGGNELKVISSAGGGTPAKSNTNLTYNGNVVYHTGNKPSKADVGLGNVTNESKATMFTNPVFTGTPTAPTATQTANNTQIATTAFVKAAVSALVDSSPESLDTLKELAQALGNDPNFATTMTNKLAEKAPLASPALTGVPTAPNAGTSTNNAQLATTAFAHNLLRNYGLDGTASQASDDWNNYKFSGFYKGSQMANAPTGVSGIHTWFYVLVMRHDNNWCTQIALDFNGVGMFKRVFNDGSWRSWSRIYSETDKPSKADVGLGNVTNESKATMFTNAVLTGTPTAPTAGTGTNNTQIATTAFVTQAVANKNSISGNAATATKLQTPRAINGVAFDGTQNITVYDSTKLPIKDISAVTDFDTLTDNCLYYINVANCTNSPLGGSHGTLFSSNKGTKYQIAIPDNSSVIYRRTWSGTSWGAWTNMISKGAVGLGNVDNTSDANKPISTATQNALNGKANSSHTHTIGNITDLQPKLNNIRQQSWVANIKCATWSRLLQLTGRNTTGHSILLNVTATRNGVVYNATFMITASHSFACNIAQIGNTTYPTSSIKLRGVVNANGDCYIEMYDNLGGATSATTQSVNVSVLDLSYSSVTKYTAFTDGTTIPADHRVLGEITTVGGNTLVANLSGNASTSTKLQTARNINGVAFDGTKDITIADGTKLPLAGGTMTGTIKWVSETSKDLLTVSGSTDGAKIQWIVNSQDNTEFRFAMSDDVSTKFSWYGNSTNLMTLQPTGSGTTVNGADLNVVGDIKSNGKTLHATNHTTLSLADKVALKGNDAWLRINDDKVFTEGVYFGSSPIRTDGTLQIGSNGATLNVHNSTFTYKGNAVYHVGNKPTKTDVGLGNVTNESKATMFTNPTLTGVPTAPNAGTNTNNAQIATTAFVHGLLDRYGLDGKALRVNISDFNSLNTTGFYTVDNSKGTVANKPTNVAGQDNYYFVLVWQSGVNYACQVVIDYFGKGMWKRICDNGTWSPWSRIYSETNKPTPNEIGAIPLAGTTVNNPNASNFSLTNGITGNLIFTNTGDSPGVARGVGGINGGNDAWAVRGYQTGTNEGALEIAVGDDGNEAIYVRQYTAGSFKFPFTNNAGSVPNRQITLMEANTGDTHFHRNVRVPGNLTVGQNTAGIITLALGDTDTGFKWISDGIFDIYSDSISVARIKKANEGIQIYKPLGVDGKLYANGDIRVRNKVDMQYNASTESLDFVFV